MLKERIVSVTKPVLQKETLFELNKLKSFIDASLKECLNKNFEKESDKINYMLEALYQIRDFVVSQTVENSVRQNLILEFQKIEQEIDLGNDPQLQEEKQLKSQEEKLEQSQTH